MRPTVTPPSGAPRDLRDADVPAFLESVRVAALAFVDGEDPHAPRLRLRLALAHARVGRPDVGIGVVDVARHRLVAEALGVARTPTVVVFVDGEAVDRVAGTPPEDVLVSMLSPPGPR